MTRYTRDCGVSIAERFWSKVDFSGPVMPHMQTPCWVWTESLRCGYGQFYVNSVVRQKGSHVIAYQLGNDMEPTGRIPGKQVDHICINPPCVRPDHLRLATVKQNLENRQGAQSNSSSGVRGVNPSYSRAGKRDGRWRARVMHNRREIRLGVFDTIEEAEAAVRAKRLELFSYNAIDQVTGIPDEIPQPLQLVRGSYNDRPVCSAGHEYTTETTYVTPNGHRVCRICRRDTQRRFSEKHRERRNAESRAYYHAHRG
jgi:HNH endonuclease